MSAGEKTFSIVLDQSKFVISFDGHDKHTAPAVAVENTWEPWQLDLYSLAIEPHHTCIDAGANVGINSIIMAHFAKLGSVHSFEPVKRTRELLQKNKDANKSNNISVIGTGLGDQTASATICVDTEALANSNIVPATSPGASGSSNLSEGSTSFEQITIQRLDDYWFGIGRPVIDFLKIDVEGYEEKVLLGAQDFLRHNRNLFLVCEMNVHTQIKSHEIENGFVGTHHLLTTIKKSFAHIYLMGRDSKLYSVSSYAQLRIFMLNGYPVDDLFCCNVFPTKLKKKLATQWSIPERLTNECELFNESSVSYINRNVDGWARPTPEIRGTRGGAILHLFQGREVKIVVNGVITKLENSEKPLAIVTINDSTKVVSIDGTDQEILLHLDSGMHFIFVESFFETEATSYFNNPIDHRRIGVRFAVEIQPVARGET